MKYLILMFVSFIVLGTSSCEKACTRPTAAIYFDGFDSAQLSTIILNQYNKNGNFSVPNSTVVYFSDTGSPGINSDTVFIQSRYGVSIPVDLNYDYIVKIPATAGSYTITDISIGNEKTGDTDPGHPFTCSLSYHINNQNKSDGSNISGNTVQLIDIFKQ